MLQLLVTTDKQSNVKKACYLIKKAKEQGANLVVLPECFNSPYGIGHFSAYAESIPGPTTKILSETAVENSIWIVAGIHE